jgi:molecular chaperone Hsp33
MLEEGLAPEDILAQLLGDFSPEIHEREAISFFCGCSKERVERALISIGPKDIREMIGDGKSIETGCSFCGKKYVFSIADLEKIYAIQMEKRKRQQEDS